MPLDAGATWLFLLFALAAEVIGTVGGFGSSVFFVPMALLFFGGPVVLGLTSVLHVFSNLAKLGLFRAGIHRWLVLWMGIPAWVGVAIGAWAITQVSFRYSAWLLGGALLVLSSVLLVRPALRLPQRPVAAGTSGALAGFWAGFTGTGGAIRGLSMAAFDLPKAVFVATSAAIDLGVDGIRMGIYLSHGFLPPALYPWVPVLLVVSVAGTWLGRRVLKALPQATFRRLVLILLLLEGLWLLAREALG